MKLFSIYLRGKIRKTFWLMMIPVLVFSLISCRQNVPSVLEVDYAVKEKDIIEDSELWYYRSASWNDFEEAGIDLEKVSFGTGGKRIRIECKGKQVSIYHSIDYYPDDTHRNLNFRFDLDNFYNLLKKEKQWGDVKIVVRTVHKAANLEEYVNLWRTLQREGVFTLESRSWDYLYQKYDYLSIKEQESIYRSWFNEPQVFVTGRQCSCSFFFRARNRANKFKVDDIEYVIDERYKQIFKAISDFAGDEWEF